ncbi:DNA polymerase [Desulforamulus ruminis]|uniref:DNA-directed DNA polymerase n=1 Tax=Desulforamulus ruminis (strain ATCC 23193 / DSM 2154 / NCIMB 8452 / DL) TaxID=696281 RepID=F6DM10_DESRL|nr:DNA polymerase [Desulforamulus ruminis]AEG59352.1 DNA-directed DNA polymerase [Desulforamulus ruminis DSM 2154]
MTILSIDIETYSSVDLAKSGVYRYTEAPDFEILLFGYAFNEELVRVIDLASGETLPESVLAALTDPEIVKTAFNANFERTCIAKHFGQPMPPEQWRCTQVHALTLGLPIRLDGVAKAMKLEQQKDSAGKALIRYFSIPCKPTKTNGQRTRNRPEHAPEKWAQFKAYCRQDVEVERTIRKALERYPIPEIEQKLWILDQKINDRGVRVDPELVAHAITCDTAYQKKLEAEAVRLTGLENPKSVAQLKSWLMEAEGLEIESLSKETVPTLLKQTESETVKRVLELRQELAKTSIKKYQAMDRARCQDNRIRGLLQFYAANRTGRWAGRLVQVQNLPQNKLKDLDLARQLLLSGEYDTLELLFESVPGVLSQLIRTAFIPSAGCRFIVADFSAIEARVIAWLAGEKWRMDVFSSHGKIYEASASQMFKIPVESITKGNPLRQKGKIAELALGYQGSVGALVQMGALKMGLKEEELPELVSSWRQANPNIVQFWRDVEKTAITAVQEKRAVTLRHGIVFSYESGALFIRLPSGRRLAYVRPKIGVNERFNKPALTYEGVEQGTKQWGRLYTYGGKLVENIVQATARDCLAESLLRLHQVGYQTVMHVHDEAVLDVPDDKDMEEAQEYICYVMGEPIPWAPGLPLRADVFETGYYKKDD